MHVHARACSTLSSTARTLPSPINVPHRYSHLVRVTDADDQSTLVRAALPGPLHILHVPVDDLEVGGEDAIVNTLLVIVYTNDSHC